MKKNLILILSLLLTISSSYSQNDENMKSLIPVVNDIQSITQKDNGAFWNIKYAAPLLFVNPENRQAVAFDIGKEPYIAYLNESVPLGNTRSNWSGKDWAMIIIPLPAHSWEYEKLILHEMFHALQPQLNFDSLYEMPCAHLEKEEGRILLRLELQALLKALEESNDKDSKYKHLINALSFRNSRYAIYPEAKEEENYTELNEGLAEYTALMMTQRYSPNKLDDSTLKEYLKVRTSLFEQQGSFVRQFAYETIPLYGYLLQMNIPDWHQKVNQKTNLTDYFMQIMDISSDKKEETISLQFTDENIMVMDIITNEEEKTVASEKQVIKINIVDNEVIIDGEVINMSINGGNNSDEEWKTLGLQYNYESIAKEEHAQVEQFNADNNVVKEKFFCVNHLEIPLFTYTYNFNPLNIRFIDSVGEYHETITITDDWGKVEASNGLILDKENQKAFLSPVIKTDNNIITGNGWKLHLNDGWGIEQKNEKMEVVKK
jgi:hypothetical protein